MWLWLMGGDACQLLEGKKVGLLRAVTWSCAGTMAAGQPHIALPAFILMLEKQIAAQPPTASTATTMSISTMRTMRL